MIRTLRSNLVLGCLGSHLHSYVGSCKGHTAMVVPYLHSCPAILGGRVQDVGHSRAHQGPQIHPEDLRGAVHSVHRVLRGLTSGPFGSGSRCFVFIFWTCQNIHLSADLLHQVRTKKNIIRL